MALRKIRLSSPDQEADLALYEYEIPEGGLREFEYAGRRFRFTHIEMPTDGEPAEGTLVYTDLTPKP